MFSRENEVNESHVAKQSFDEPYALVCARTDLWESWEGNLPRPPDRLKARSNAMKCMWSRVIKDTRRLLKKGRAARKRRLKGPRGRGTAATDKPPIFGMIQRGGQVVLRMLENVQQTTIQPIIEKFIKPGTLINTDEYNIYSRLVEWGCENKNRNRTEHEKGRR